MSDLTDEEIGHWRSVKAGREMFGIELDHAQRHLMRAIDELQRHRSALAADRERVEMVVHEILNVILTEEEPRWSIAKHQKVCQRIATRAADQLATVRPSSKRKRLVTDTCEWCGALPGSLCVGPAECES